MSETPTSDPQRDAATAAMSPSIERSPAPAVKADARMKARLQERLFGDGKQGPHDWRAADTDLSGIVFDDKYSLTEKLGAGGMGIVYQGEHVKMGKSVAIKILKPEISDDPEFYARFVREAQAASQIDHPNVVRVSDMGEHEDIIYYVMDLLRGEDMRGMLKRMGKIPWPKLRSIALQLLDGVGAAHARGIVHRDLKPDNVFISATERGDEVRILDFGIAKVLRADASGVSITTDGKILGSPRYMSPEQALGGRPDERSDIYSLGILLYEAITGVPPFADRLMLKVLKMHVEDPPPPFAEVAPDLDIDPRVEAAIAKALDKKAEHRFQTAPEFAAALRAVPGTPGQAVEEHEGGTDKRVLVAVAVAVGLLILAAGIVVGKLM